MELVPNMDTRKYIPCKSELLSPHNDWQLSWRLCRLRGLSSEMMSFNFKLLHHLLPVRSRLHQITSATPPNCTLCPCACPETIEHSLIFCPYNAGTGMALVSAFKNELPSLTTEQLLLYNFPDLSETLEFSLVFLTAALLLEVWTRRIKKSKITLYDIRTTLEAKISLLRETRYHNMNKTMEEIIALI